MEDTDPYAQGEWLKLEVRQDLTPLTSVVQYEETEGNEQSPRPDHIMRGPLWNYKQITDPDEVLFGLKKDTLSSEKQNILEGPSWTPSKHSTSSSFISYLFKRMKKFNPDHIALVEVETGRSLTFGQLIHKAQSLACGLRWIGITPGQVVAVISYNSLEAQTMILASLLIGSVASTMDANLNAVDLATQLRISTPQLIYSEGGKTLSKVETALKYMMTAKPPRVVVSSPHHQENNYLIINQLMREVEPHFQPEFRKANPLNPIFILFSSGSTGSPKGVLISERFFMNSPGLFQSWYSAAGILYTAMTTSPLTWISTVNTFFLHLSKGHKTVFFRGPPSEAVIINALHKFKVALWLTGPAALMHLLNWPVRPRCKDLHVVVATGMCIPLSNLLKIRDQLFQGKVHVCQIYGLTETGILTGNIPLMNKIGSVGKVISNSQMKVLEEATGLTLEAYRVGELCFKTQSLMLGYYNDPENTETVFDSDGFFHTGDLGYYDNEGFVFVTSRKKEMIKWKSYQIIPSEVEAKLVIQPEVKEAMVFGIYNDKDGEDVTAAVILNPNCNEVTPEVLEKLANTYLSDSRRIRGGVHFFDHFPCTSTGKPIKHLIAKEVLDRIRRRDKK